MTHPDWVLKHKIKGTELRKFGDRYYLYNITSKWDKERKVTRKITLGMVGTITENDGLIPKGEKRNAVKQKKITSVCVKEYGATNFLLSLSNDIIESLRENFSGCWQEILMLAMNRLLYQSPLKNIDFLYQESFVSNTMPNLNLDKNALTNLMRELGGSREAIVKFFKKFVTRNQNIIFDTTHIFSQSKQMKLSNIGYNSKREFEPQVNLFYMFSTDKQQPAYYRIFPGNISGMKALKLSILESGVEHCCTVGDKGFASEENFLELESANLNYIFPLKRNSQEINYKRLKSRDFNKAHDGYFLYNNRPIFYYQQKAKAGRKITVFYDPKLKTDEEASYLRRVDQKLEGYNLENYLEKQYCFGTMSMISNLKEASAQEIYVKYKHRMEVETLFDTYKNLLDADSSYMHSDEGFEAWTFINHIAIILYYKVFKLLKEHDKLSNISPHDLLLKLSKVAKIKINNTWHSAEINSKSSKLFAQLNIHVT